MRPLKVIGIIFALTGSPVGAQRIEVRDGQAPAPSIEQTIPIGGVIFERYRYGIVHTLVTEDWIEGRNFLVRLAIPPGGHMVPVSDTKACFVMHEDEVGGFYNRGCAIDADGDGAFERLAGVGAGKINPPVAYHDGEMRISRVNDNFERKITYLGMSGDTLRLSYREFINDMARPAFTEELSLPLPKTFPARIVVKDTTFVILGISGEGVRYTVAPR